MIDFLIVGFGITGACLTSAVENSNASFHVIDPLTKLNASHIAAGIVNPITGRKYALQWHIETLLQKAIVDYKRLELKLNTQFLHERMIIKIHKSEQALQEWQLKKHESSIQNYIDEYIDLVNLNKVIDYRFGAIGIKHALQVNLSQLLTNYETYLKNNNLLIEAKFNHEYLVQKDACFEYLGITYQNIVFCEGINGLHNPFFNYSMFKPAKGECLHIEIPNLKTNAILHKGIILAPIQNDIYWVGATNTWNDDNPMPTSDGKSFLVNQINNLLKTPYKIIQHKAAIRPTIIDRTPIVGSHKTIKNMYILNGMGTKATALAPYYADLLLKNIENGLPLPLEVNIKRFFN